MLSLVLFDLVVREKNIFQNCPFHYESITYIREKACPIIWRIRGFAMRLVGIGQKNASQEKITSLKYFRNTSIISFGLIDWLIDWIMLYAVSAIFQPFNGGRLWPLNWTNLKISFTHWCFMTVFGRNWLSGSWGKNRAQVSWNFSSIYFPPYQNKDRRYMAVILPIWRVTLFNQSILYALK